MQKEKTLKYSILAQKAFTLAEVLITLVIIGIIAAMTIPNLIRNKEKQETLSQLKKVYSGMNQAIKLAEIDNGSCSTWDWGVASQGAAVYEPKESAILRDVLLPKLKYMKYCGRSANQGCFAPAYYDLDLKNYNALDASTGLSKAVLTDGTSIGLKCESEHSLYVDLNGANKPNRLGYDTFIFFIDTSACKMSWYRFSDDYCTPGTTNNGWTHGGTCVKRIIEKDNWDITYR